MSPAYTTTISIRLRELTAGSNGEHVNGVSGRSALAVYN